MKTSPQSRRHHCVTPFLFPLEFPYRFLLRLLWFMGGSSELVPCRVIILSNEEVA